MHAVQAYSSKFVQRNAGVRFTCCTAVKKIALQISLQLAEAVTVDKLHNGTAFYSPIASDSLNYKIKCSQ